MGPDSPWELEGKDLMQYCEHCFLPAGFVEPMLSDDKTETVAYRISYFGFTSGMALAGGLGRWSLHHAEALRQIFGPSNSAGTVRAAHSRIDVLAATYFGANDSPSLSDISGAPSSATDPNVRLN